MSVHGSFNDNINHEPTWKYLSFIEPTASTDFG